MEQRVRYCGRDFPNAELERIKRLIADNPESRRAALSRLVCDMLDWRRLDGRMKDMSCRVAMLRMQDDGLIQLPPPRNGNNNGKRYLRRSPGAEPEPVPFIAPVDSLADLCLQQVTDRKESHLWNEYIDRYHYLGYQPLPGAQLRYFVRDANRILALLGFGASAWKTAPRDRFIGWTREQRKLKLHLVINNARFLILPWIRSRNLASKILGMATSRIADDWQQRYGYRPVMAETFVEIPRFHGTCYKAANWIYVGKTKGRGKLERQHKALLAKKTIWIYPLTRNYRRLLCGSSPSATVSDT